MGSAQLGTNRVNTDATHEVSDLDGWALLSSDPRQGMLPFIRAPWPSVKGSMDSCCDTSRIIGRRMDEKHLAKHCWLSGQGGKSGPKDSCADRRAMDSWSLRLSLPET